MRPLTDAEQKQYRTLLILAIAMLIAAPIFYAMIGLYLPKRDLGVQGANDMLAYILVIISLVLPLAMNLVIKVQKSSFRKNTSSKMSTAQFIFTLSIQKFAFAEAVFVFGLVTTFATGSASRLWWFYLIGAAMVFYVWPRRRKFEELIEELEQP